MGLRLGYLSVLEILWSSGCIIKKFYAMRTIKLSL
jgi:hypothetical protein